MKGLYFALFFLLFCIVFAIETTNTWYHEQVHKAIFNYLGYPATVQYSMLGLDGETSSNASISEADYLRMYPLHSENEIVGYNLVGIRWTLYIILFTLWVLILVVNKK